jgi:hypothetical protein
MVSLSFGKRQEKGTEGNKDEKLENGRFSRSQQWRPLRLFWEIFTMVNYLHCQ